MGESTRARTLRAASRAPDSPTATRLVGCFAQRIERGVAWPHHGVAGDDQVEQREPVGELDEHLRR
jgi:hypothetical protein